jgi:hypothetical protein
MRPLVDYLPLLTMPAAGLIILVVGWIVILRDKADRKRHNHPAE